MPVGLIKPLGTSIIFIGTNQKTQADFAIFALAVNCLCPLVHTCDACIGMSDVF